MTNLFAKNEEFIRRFLPDEHKGKKPTLVDISNVCAYVQNLPHDDFSDKDYILDLPWDLTWFEYLYPTTVMYDGEIQKMEDRMCIGVLAYNKGDYNHYDLFSNQFRDRKFSWKGWEEPKDLKYLGSCDTYIPNRKSDKSESIAGPFLTYMKRKGLLEYDIVEGLVVNELSNVFYATTFCHCNNVEYYEQSHPEALQKANIKRGKTPQETYKILDIGGLKKQAKSESNEERGELQTAIHICRGHFKTYTEENPLFGKHTGTYWWPMHKRGSEEIGKINKDYNIVTD